MRRVLVIGGNGFIGSSLIAALLRAGCMIRVLDQTSARVDFDWHGIDYRQGSLADVDTLPAMLADMDMVFHLASTTVPSTSNLDPIADVQANLCGVLNLCQAMQRAQVRRIVFFSSGGTVYGEPVRLPMDEDHPLRPISSYGVIKVAIENYLMMYQQLGTIDPLILRPSNPYGPRQSGAGVQGVVAAFLSKARSGEGVRIWGDGEITRDYLFIDDLIELSVQAALTSETGIFNAGSGIGHTLNEILHAVREVTSQALPVEYLPARDFDVKEVVLDISKARERFTWSPGVSLSNGISKTWFSLK